MLLTFITSNLHLKHNSRGNCCGQMMRRKSLICKESYLLHWRSKNLCFWCCKSVQCDDFGYIKSKSLLNSSEFHQRSVSGVPLFFRGPSVTQDSYLAMLEKIAYPELNQEGDVIFQQDGTVLLHTTRTCVSEGRWTCDFLASGLEEVVQFPGQQEALMYHPLISFSGVMCKSVF